MGLDGAVNVEFLEDFALIRRFLRQFRFRRQIEPSGSLKPGDDRGRLLISGHVRRQEHKSEDRKVNQKRSDAIPQNTAGHYRLAPGAQQIEIGNLSGRRALQVSSPLWLGLRCLGL